MIKHIKPILHVHLLLCEVSTGIRCIDFVWKVWNTTPEDEVRLAGLDGWSLLEFVRLNLRIMTILAPFLLAVVLPVHFVASTESHNRLDLLSCLDIGNLPRADWMLWFHAAVVWFVVLISAWQSPGGSQTMIVNMIFICFSCLILPSYALRCGIGGVLS